jgi:hypothetical protein
MWTELYLKDRFKGRIKEGNEQGLARDSGDLRLWSTTLGIHADCFSKQARQNTGLPWLGRKGTVVSVPHSAQTVRVSGRVREALAARLALHSLQCLGSFANCLAWKKRCSSAVKTKSFPQTTHFKTRSWKSISGFLTRA